MQSCHPRRVSALCAASSPSSTAKTPGDSTTTMAASTHGDFPMRRSFWRFAVIAAPLAANPVHGAVMGSNADGFTVREEVEFAGSPASAWKRLIDLGSWWSPEHTYSGRSSNLTLTLRRGGCWCETLENGGFVRHLEVVLVIPEKTLRLTGGLGPLQGIGATGALTS